MTAKQKALEAISSLPEDTAPQEIIQILTQLYSIKRGLARPAGERREDARQSALWGSLRGSVVVPVEVDLTEPVLSDPMDAAQGRLHG